MVREVDPHAHPGRPRQADRRRGEHRGDEDLEAERHRADRASPSAHRLRLPVLQPAPDAERRGERRPPVGDRRRQAGQEVGGRADGQDRPREPPRPPSIRALRWTAAARRDRAGTGQQADDRLRRRADRQSRLEDERRDPRPDAGFRRHVRPDHRDGHARPARGGDRRPHPVPGRRADRERSRPLRSPRGDRGDGRAGAMNAVALKGLLGRKLRTVLTALAIVLGVSMISGTYVLTDTITAAFTNVVSDSYENADAVGSGKVAFTNTNSNTEETPAFPATVLAKVKALPDVAAAAGSVADTLKLIDRDGKVISTGGGEAIAASVDPANDKRFNPLKLVAGKWPVGNGQIAIDKRTSETHHYAVGDSIGIAADEGIRQLEIAGIATFSSSSSIGASTIAIFDVPTAQQFFDKVGKFDQVQVAAKPGVTPAALVGQIRPLLPPTAQAKTAAAQTQEAVDDVNSTLGIFQKVLLAFG